MRKASFILPPGATADGIETCIDSLLSQGWKNLEVLVFRNPHGAPGGANLTRGERRVVTVDTGTQNDSLPRLLNRAVSQASGDAVFFVAECVVFDPRFTEICLDRLFRQDAGAWVYGCFQEFRDSAEPRLRDVRTNGSDLSEGSQIGPVRGARRECLEAVGVYDEDLTYAFEYDLRLRILERYAAVRIDEPLYAAHRCAGAASEPVRSQMEHYRGYVHSADTARARSYLDYTEPEEAEFRAVCRRSLARRHALLESPGRSLKCPHFASGTKPVTVVIPLWNREEYIGQALDSVLRSRGCEFEIVVVDNGSSDRGVPIVEQYRREWPVRLIRNRSNNVAGALNAGIRASSGKYVCQLDSDDLYTPDTLRVLVENMEAHPGAALGVSYYDCIGPDGNPLPDPGVVKHLEYDPDNLIRTDGLGAARIWHRCVLEELGGFDEGLGNYAEDYDLQLKLSERYPVLRIPHVLYHYRVGHKKPGETIDYSERHRKKTQARRAALERRRRLNGVIVCNESR